MQATSDTQDFKPPRAGRWPAPLVLALGAHVLLMAALTWGVHWQQNATPVAFEAELWSSLPQEAAPRAVEPPPPPPEPEPKPEPTPEPEVRPEPPPPVVKQPDIATIKAKKKIEEDQRKVELEKARKEKADKAAREKKEREDKRKDELRKKQELAKKQAQEKREAAAAEKARQDNIRRMLGQAGATGGASAKGTAQRSSGPSAGYGARVAARIRPNILFTDPISGNPSAEVEVRTLPDGTITGRRLVRSSGNAAWDKAALDAIDRTGSLPRDTDGQVPSPFIIVLRPKD